MIKAILFDLDGVLTTDKNGSSSTCKYLSKTTGIDYELLLKTYAKYNRDLSLGKTTHKDIWNDFCNEVGQNIDHAILEESFVNTPIDKEMESMARKLKKHYKIGLITDNKSDRINSIFKTNNWENLFDAVSVSADIGCVKDNPKIFEVAIEKLGVSFEECVFIDNQEKNLAVPKQMGMKTILFDDEKRDYAELNNIIGMNIPKVSSPIWR